MSNLRTGQSPGHGPWEHPRSLLENKTRNCPSLRETGNKDSTRRNWRYYIYRANKYLLSAYGKQSTILGVGIHQQITQTKIPALVKFIVQ